MHAWHQHDGTSARLDVIYHAAGELFHVDVTIRHPTAAKYLRQAAKKDQKNVRAFALLGEVLAMQGELRKAIGAFNFALKLSPKYFDAWLSRAKVLLDMGLVSDVQKSYTVLARNEPDLANELLAAIDIWLTERELPLNDTDGAFIEWRNSQT